ncbi:MAG: hypothetical protein K9G76_09120 [Bacteroidales bacterium]|nr:hypothetical protein [Bacteroidales bacterium]MCF8403711.1 hypothetical protein [Bacteroidales bacterium]
MDKTIILLFFLSCSSLLYSQDKGFKSIHQTESEYYHKVQNEKQVFPIKQKNSHSFQELNKKVFGYHPYWAGNNYLNYQWDLLSDFCHFSYEVDPATGNAITNHDWNTSPAIDSALAHQVKVHLCVTLFSGHAAFFTNPEAQEALITNIIDLIGSRGAHGVNMDIEALPSAYKEEFMAFMQELRIRINNELPGTEISIASPAVNWSNKFNIPELNEILDFFMVMSYDYYWGGSSQAGPSSPVYPMIEFYNYSFSRTISYYQSQGVPADKLIMGVPYYAYQWPTQGQYAPSATTASGSAYTYSNIKNNTSGNYSPENKHREPNSRVPYYSFQTGGWNQCFLDDVYSLGEKYDIVNRRKLSGIGIWALGYDDGYTELWDLIADKFTTSASITTPDTIFDTGGEVVDYYDNESYLYTLTTNPGTQVYLGFSYLNLEEDYDTLWIYDGPDVTSPLLGLFSGDSIPEMITASANSLCLKFFSDGATTEAGWKAIFDTVAVSGVTSQNMAGKPTASPNPCNDLITITLPQNLYEKGALKVSGVNSIGQTILNAYFMPSNMQIQIDIASWPKGIYYLLLQANKKEAAPLKIIKI